MFDPNNMPMLPNVSAPEGRTLRVTIPGIGSEADVAVTLRTSVVDDEVVFEGTFEGDVTTERMATAIMEIYRMI
jgi:hypothetical protein